MNRAHPTVLVVESDPAALASFTEALNAAGYRLLASQSFDDATRLLRERRPDVLITELRLGLYNGLHLVLKGRGANPGMAAIVMTHHPDPVLKAEAEGLDARYMEMPVDPATLLGTIDRLLDGLEAVRAG